MRKIDQETKAHFESRTPFKSGNTLIKVVDNEVYLYLHGNLIAKADAKSLFITHAGYPTNVTKSRLNAIGANIYQRSFEWYLNGTRWDGSWTDIKEK